LRFDVLDIVDRCGHSPLGDGDYAFFHLVRRNSGKRPYNADYRNIDVGKNVGGSNQACDTAQQSDQNSHYDERIWPSQRKPDDPHGLSIAAQNDPDTPKQYWL
jgi:hypothetical protein